MTREVSMNIDAVATVLASSFAPVRACFYRDLKESAPEAAARVDAVSEGKVMTLKLLLVDEHLLEGH